MFKYFIIFILLIVFVPAVRRFLFWLLVGRSIVNEQRKTNQQFEQKKQKEGEIKVEKNTNGNKSRFEGGQYVDYEEVKD